MMLSPERLRAWARVAGDASGVRPLADGRCPGATGPVRKMPTWVGRFVVLSDSPSECWLWCDPAVPPGETFPSQFVIERGAGRYFVEAFEAANGTCVSRESAEGGLVVAGLPPATGPVLVCVRQVQPNAPGSTGRLECR